MKINLNFVILSFGSIWNLYLKSNRMLVKPNTLQQYNDFHLVNRSNGQLNNRIKAVQMAEENWIIYKRWPHHFLWIMIANLAWNIRIASKKSSIWLNWSQSDFGWKQVIMRKYQRKKYQKKYQKIRSDGFSIYVDTKTLVYWWMNEEKWF